MGQQAESIGIALKMGDVFPEMRANYLLDGHQLANAGFSYHPRALPHAGLLRD